MARPCCWPRPSRRGNRSSQSRWPCPIPIIGSCLSIPYQASVMNTGLDAGDIFTHPLPIGFSVRSEPNSITHNAHLETNLHRAVNAILFEGTTEPDANNVDFMWHWYRDRECERRGIVGTERQALLELDGLRWRTGNLPLPPTPALETLSPQRRKELKDILNTKMHRVWNNRKCDAEGLYIHASHALNTTAPQHAVFVTSDKNFKRYRRVLKKTNWERLQALGFPCHVMEPDKAVAYFLMVTGATLADSDE